PTAITIPSATLVIVDIPLARTKHRYNRANLMMQFEQEMEELSRRYGMQCQDTYPDKLEGMYVFSVDSRTTGMALDQAKKATGFAIDLADVGHLLRAEANDDLFTVKIGVHN
ncbi:hypothetical protein HDU67_005236, partial [Dinochytrium kinnereticum]